MKNLHFKINVWESVFEMHFENLLNLLLYNLTLLVPRGFWYPHTKHRGGGGKGSKWTPKYLKNDKCYKPETLEGVRDILEGLKKFQADITTVLAW